MMTTGMAATAPRHRTASRSGVLIRVAIVGATGYAGAEAVRLLARHPNVRIVGLVGRGREHEPIGQIQPHLASTGLRSTPRYPIRTRCSLPCRTAPQRR